MNQKKWRTFHFNGLWNITEELAFGTRQKGKVEKACSVLKGISP